MDETPVMFDITGIKTIDVKGTKSFHIKNNKSFSIYSRNRSEKFVYKYNIVILLKS